MLGSFFFTKLSFKAGQAGFYLDFFLKKISDRFLRNFLICASQFFGEKYIIESLSKKLVESCIFYFSKKINLNYLAYDMFFINLLNVIILIYFFLCITFFA